MSTAPQTDKNDLRNGYMRTGWFGTAIWLILVIGLIVWKWDDLVAMHLNELGDFLAGAVAPLALLWFILGYFLQSAELGLQREISREQAETQRKRLELDQYEIEQAERIRDISARPNLTLEAVKRTSEDTLKAHVKNRGSPIYNLHTLDLRVWTKGGQVEEKGTIQISTRHFDQSTDNGFIIIKYPGNLSPKAFEFHLAYRDINQKTWVQLYLFDITINKFLVKPCDPQPCEDFILGRARGEDIWKHESKLF